ncbi:MAG: hypothetical protein AAGD38_12995 [Acidobacteriota bacterium]
MRTTTVFFLLLVTSLATAAFAAAPPRGYEARACGFDMNRDGVFGGAGDCDVCDGVTTDPDSDGVSEDLIYVDCQTGVDLPSCGAPGAPCRTITYAWGTRADGPSDGAEDIVCFRGTCAEESISPAFGGYSMSDAGANPGAYQVAGTGSETRNWYYPLDPTMLVGWDSDNDGRYPPFDNDDTAVLDGDGLDRAFVVNWETQWIEMAHFRVEGYGSSTSATSTGFVRFSPTGSVQRLRFLFFHDLELIDINRARTLPSSQASSVVAINFFTGGTRPRNVQFKNILVADNGGWFVRGEVPPSDQSQPDSGPFRFQNITRTARGCNFSQCGDSAATTAFRLWGDVSGVEILDSIWDANVAAWEPKPEGGPTGARFLDVSQCSQDFHIRNNHIVDNKIAVTVRGFSNGFCDDNDARPVDEIYIDRNLITNDYEAWRFGDAMIQTAAAGDNDPDEMIGLVEITNNVLISSTGWEAAIWIRNGHQTLPDTSQIRIAHNTMIGDINRHGAIVIGNPETSDHAFVPQNIEIYNNIIADLGNGDRAIQTTYNVTGYQADRNVFDPDASWEWNDNPVASLASWRSSSGAETNSFACEIEFRESQAPGRLNFYDTCVRDLLPDPQGPTGPDTPVFDWRHTRNDIDFDRRGRDGAWDLGADEHLEILYLEDFESGMLPE